MNWQKEREDLLKAARMGAASGWMAGSGGNLSLLLPGGEILISPTSRSLAWLEPEELVLVGADGRPAPGQSRPSSELAMHQAAYAARPAARAVVHAHPPLALAFTLACRELPVDSLPELLVKLGRVPTVGYLPPASQGLADAVAPLLPRYKALLLAHHGALAVGDSLEEAWSIMDELEHSARTLLAAGRLGGAAALPLADREALVQMGRDLGLLPPAEARRPLLDQVEIKELPRTDQVMLEKRASDQRGEAHLIVGDLPFKRLAYLTLEPGTGFRGGHMHLRKREGLYTVSGQGTLELVDKESGQRREVDLRPGVRAIVPPGLAHRVSARATLHLIEFADQPWSAEDDLPFEF